MPNAPEAQIQALEQAKLESVLGSIRQSNTFELTDWQVQSLTKGSLTGNVFRLSGTGIDNGTSVNWSLILKFLPSPASDQSDTLSINLRMKRQDGITGSAKCIFINPACLIACPAG